jgi:hypothetical protein
MADLISSSGSTDTCTVCGAWFAEKSDLSASLGGKNGKTMRCLLNINHVIRNRQREGVLLTWIEGQERTLSSCDALLVLNGGKNTWIDRISNRFCSL